MMLTLVYFIVPYCLGRAASEIASVWAPDDPNIAPLGSSISLPCALFPPVSAVALRLRWYRPGNFDTPVLVYENQSVKEDAGDPRYRGRVSLGDLEKGNMSLKLENITLADRGPYVCLVQWNTWNDTAKLFLSARVVGSSPIISFVEGEDGQVDVSCISHGWFPQPEVTWRDKKGQVIDNHRSPIYNRDEDDLVTVGSWLLFSPSESEWISCSVSLSDQEWRESRVVPPVLTRYSGIWISLCVIILVLWLLVIILLLVLHNKDVCKVFAWKCSSTSKKEYHILGQPATPDVFSVSGKDVK
ncbi:butyrophilin subfamily 1 member A1-like [Denticeps clupeoides]|uniref:butyrophilin subfamily 1 member A1-like n=1 Tax=Denticeps clupeoides TaxID=299321 RepID=UPI0010A4684D|nr:butyrophilin subfamily 1 member A1-like [Denticeps clupeoides]